MSEAASAQAADTPPVRNGAVYVQRAADYYGKPLRIVIDANRAQVVDRKSVV